MFLYLSMKSNGVLWLIITTSCQRKNSEPGKKSRSLCFLPFVTHLQSVLFWGESYKAMDLVLDKSMNVWCYSFRASPFQEYFYIDEYSAITMEYGNLGQDERGYLEGRSLETVPKLKEVWLNWVFMNQGLNQCLFSVSHVLSVRNLMVAQPEATSGLMECPVRITLTSSHQPKDQKTCNADLGTVCRHSLGRIPSATGPVSHPCAGHKGISAPRKLWTFVN